MGTLTGGSGTDTADFSKADRALTLSLAADVTLEAGDKAAVALRSVEGVIGSAYGDTLTGAGTDDVLQGNGGDDVFWGGRGNDTYYGGTKDGGDAGRDTVDYSQAGGILAGGITVSSVRKMRPSIPI